VTNARIADWCLITPFCSAHEPHFRRRRDLVRTHSARA
jgi:hypothetical protein